MLIRNSVLLATEKQVKKADNLGLTWKDLFSKSENLTNEITHKFSPFPIDLTPQKETLEKQFAYLFELAEKTDKSFSGAVKAQEVKQKKGLENLEKRLLKAQKENFRISCSELLICNANCSRTTAFKSVRPIFLNFI